MIVRRTSGHTRGHSVVRLVSGGDRLTFLGDAVFPNHFDRPDWHNAFDHNVIVGLHVLLPALSLDAL